MSLKEVMEVANGWGIWICAGIAVSVIIVQTVLFIRLSFKNAEGVGLSKDDAKKAFKTGLISSVGPAISVFVVVFAMTALVGGPMTWMRLNMTGGSAVILKSAEIGAASVGESLGSEGFTLTGLSASWFSIAANGIGWLIILFFLNHRMEKVRTKIGGGDPRWLQLLTASVTLGLFGFFAAPEILKGGGYSSSVIAGGVSMAVMLFVAKNPKLKWLKEYALGFALVIGMIFGSMLG
ncbi:DUF5058 domain-containing protein [Erysipelothrix urinaevulpis]|uniref:DUF5058 family protein n=1 Tax=Erysipelothrix urinaevulpis TaxID=2683717 RepID=UPI00135C4466|nr:DUF5058 family protein [Erysipelothrix urinaevulpis]